jgi:hypothetical protein
MVTSYLGGHPNYLDRWLHLARPKFPSVATLRRGATRRELQRGASDPAPPGTCRSSKAGESALSDGQAMMRFSPMWEAGCSGVPSLDNEQWQRTRVSFACKTSSHETRPSEHQRKGRGLHEKPRPNETSTSLSREKPSWNGSRSCTALQGLLRLAQRTTPTGDEGPRRDTIPGLFWHYYYTVARCHFTILTFVTNPP